MTVLGKTLAVTGWSTLGGAAAWLATTRHCKMSDIPRSDYLFNHTLFARYNPNNAPVTQDVCTRTVPLSKIKPELLEAEKNGREGALVTAFCQGVWGGIGYAYQRRYLEKKYRSMPETKGQLWDRAELKTSPYGVGTQITDHFEVVSKTPESIIVRCGDTPRNAQVRESDGLFEMRAQIKEKEGVAEFALKSLFYNGLAMPDKEGTSEGPMGPWTQWAHAQYAKLWMETALRGNVMK